MAGLWGRYGFRVVISATRELAVKELASGLRAGPLGAAILVSDQLSNEPDTGSMNQQPMLTPWGQEIQSLFPDSPLGTVALTRWARRVPDIDRVVGWDIDRPSLVEALLRTIRTLEYKAPPDKGALDEPVVVRLVRTEAELEDYFRLRHRIYSVMGYLPDEIEAAPLRARDRLEFVIATRSRSPHFRLRPGW